LERIADQPSNSRYLSQVAALKETSSCRVSYPFLSPLDPIASRDARASGNYATVLRNKVPRPPCVLSTRTEVCMCPSADGHIQATERRDGKRRAVTSGDVNSYLKENSGRDVTAKDFRTWAGTLTAAIALNELALFETVARAERNLKAAIARVSSLGNTPTICRKCYVHPEVLNGYLERKLVLEIELASDGALVDELARLRAEETALLILLRSRSNGGVSAPI
jgi:DNA topoisomerase IB